MTVEITAVGFDDDVCPACGGTLDDIAAPPDHLVVVYCIECDWTDRETVPSCPPARERPAAAATRRRDIEAVLCDICHITPADVIEPSQRHCGRHSKHEGPPCKWAKANERLYRFVRKGGDIETLACLFCLIPKRAEKGTRWAALHRRYDEPTCQHAFDADRRSRPDVPNPTGDASALDFFVDSNGAMIEYGTLTRDQYMTARSNT